MDRTLGFLLEINRHVVAAFDRREQRPWGVEVTLIELSKQVGDLARAVLTHERYYLADRVEDHRYGGGVERVADELADIFYCTLRLADHYGIDLEAAHLRARASEWAYLYPGQAPPWLST